MDAARQGKNGSKVLAVDARRRDVPYFCLKCGLSVHLRRGRIREPHFAHTPGEGTPECDLYTFSAGSHGGTGDGHAAPAISELKLGIVPIPNWSLYLVVPEVPKDQLGNLPLHTLRASRMTVYAGPDRLRDLSGLEFRPGVGEVHVRVPASVSTYQVTAGEQWPIGVILSELGGRATGLTQSLTAFSCVNEEWVRRPLGSVLFWGEQAIFVSGTAVTPPKQLLPVELVPVAQKGVRWRAWRAALPRKPDGRVKDWLAEHGYGVGARPWRVLPHSVPIRVDSKTGLPVYRQGTRILVELVAPYPGDEAKAIATDGASIQAWSARAPARDRSDFAAVLASTYGEWTVSADEDGDGTAHFLAEAPPSLTDLRSALTRLPLLQVAIGDQVVQGWGRLQLDLARKLDKVPPVSVAFGREDLDVVAAVAWRGQRERGRRDRLRADQISSAVAVALGKAEASIVLIDAGPLGRVEVVVRKALGEEENHTSVEHRAIERLLARSSLSTHASGGRPAWQLRQLLDLRRARAARGERPLSDLEFNAWAARQRLQLKD